MNKTGLRSLGRPLGAFLAATAIMACGTEPTMAPTTATSSLRAAVSQRVIDLGDCGRLAAPAGSKLAFHAYATGVQIYTWTGSTWRLDGPDAVLSADREGNSVVGVHYAGPTWESVSGGKVVGSVIDRCPADPSSIPWLLLGARTQGPGVFSRVTHIQRVNTVGGNAPSTGGTVGDVVRVPYSAEYLFYRAP